MTRPQKLLLQRVLVPSTAAASSAGRVNAKHAGAGEGVAPLQGMQAKQQPGKGEAMDMEAVMDKRV